jgi:hypothetical protein
MYLIQLLLPLYDNDGHDLPKALFGEVRDELMEKFSGLTVFSQAPVKGLWQEDGSHTVHDELVIYEVMTDSLDQPWWQHYRASLETRFRQEEVVVRAQTISLL